MPWLVPLVMAGASIGSGIAAKKEAEADRDAKLQLIKQSVEDLEAIGIPSVEAQQIVLQKYQDAGDWTPELADAVKLGDTNLEGISTSPEFKEAQLRALGSLQDIADKGGLNLQDRANLEKTLGNINADERGAREAILAKTRAKGQMGSGLELVAQLMNQQDASTKSHDEGLRIQALAQQRALDAISQGGKLGGDLRSQEFNEKARIAEAQDLINRWNAQNTQSVTNSNVGTINDASKYNLNNRQALMNANIDTANKQEIANKSLIADNFNRQLDLAKAKANARNGVASEMGARGDRTAQMWQGIGQGVSNAAQGVAENEKRQDEWDRDNKRWNDYMDVRRSEAKQRDILYPYKN